MLSDCDADPALEFRDVGVSSNGPSALAEAGDENFTVMDCTAQTPSRLREDFSEGVDGSLEGRKSFKNQSAEVSKHF